MLKALQPELYKKFGVIKIGIFGSVAREEANQESDLDIVYEIEKPNIFTTVHLKSFLEQKLNCRIDLVRFRKNMQPLLRKRIERDGVYVR